jgi:WD40 repeat protein
MDERAAVKRRRTNPQSIGVDGFGAFSYPAFLYGFQTAMRQLEAVFPSRYGGSYEINALNAMISRVCSQNRLLLIFGGRLCAMLAWRLLCFNGECTVRYAHRLGISVLSQRHSFGNSSATCVATLEGHSGGVQSMAFHPTAPLLATGSDDDTVRLWLLSCDNSSATCVATLAVHSNWVTSVAFHPTAPLLATGSDDKTVRLWLLSCDNSSATCVATLAEHSREVTSVAFHPTAPLLATGSEDRTVRLWLLSCDNSSATCVATLEGHCSAFCLWRFTLRRRFWQPAAGTTPCDCGADDSPTLFPRICSPVNNSVVRLWAIGVRFLHNRLVS